MYRIADDSPLRKHKYLFWLPSVSVDLLINEAGNPGGFFGDAIELQDDNLSRSLGGYGNQLSRFAVVVMRNQ